MSETQTEPAVEPKIQEKPVTPQNGRTSWEKAGPTWRWLVGILVIVLGFFVALWMDSMSKGLTEIASYARQSAETSTKALSIQAERTASLEAWRSAADARLGRIESGQDRMEGKLDRVLERK